MTSPSADATCLLHIGLDLTGAPEIRAALRNRPAAGKWTLATGGDDPGQALAAAVAAQPQALPHLRRTGWSDEEIARHAAGQRLAIEAELHAHAGHDLLISSESLLHLGESDLARLRDFLAPHFATVRVVAFVAPPADSMAATFCERLKTARQLLDPGRTWPAYRQRLEKFELTFGRERMRILPLPADVGAALGLGPIPAPAPALLPLDAAALLFAYRKYGGQHDRAKKDMQRDRALVQQLADPGGPPFAFSDAFVAALRERKADDVRWVEERLGGPLPASTADDGFRDGADLLRRSVAAAGRLQALRPELAGSPPRTAREAAQVVHDLGNALVPPAPGETPNGAFPATATAAERENLLQADRLTMKGGPVCYLHIGMAKTGTTSIQGTLRDAERSTEYGYLKAGPANHSRLMVSLFKKNPARFPFYRKTGWSAEQIQAYVTEMKAELEAELAANAHRTFIISGESMITLAAEELVAMREFLGRYFPEIRVVAYLRAPKSYMESIFQQRLKGGSFQTDFASAYPDYTKKIRKFDEVFGAEQVILRKFDPALFPKRDVVLDFCQLLGLSLRGYEATKVNESLSLEAIALLFAYRKFGGKFGSGENVLIRNNKMIKTLRLIRGGKLAFSSAMVAAIIDRQREDIEWLEQRAGFSLGSVPAEDPPGAIATPRELLKLSMAGARGLMEVMAGKFTPTISDPQRPREAARVLHDYLVTLDPTLEGAFPAAVAPRTKPEDAKPLLRRFGKWLRGGQP